MNKKDTVILAGRGPQTVWMDERWVRFDEGRRLKREINQYNLKNLAELYKYEGKLLKIIVASAAVKRGNWQQLKT